MHMLLNYFKIAWRNIAKQKLTGFISVSSLALGLAVCFIIGLYVLHEWSYDRFIPDNDRIVRIVLETENGYRPAMPPGMANALEQGVAGMESLTEVSNPQELLMKTGNGSFNVGSSFWADSNFTDIFPPEVMEGDASRALSQPGQAVLTKSTAARLFGSEGALGKTIEVEYGPGIVLDHEVGAVVEDPPSNMHFTYNALLSLTHPYHRSERYGGEVQWNYWGGYVYAKLNEEVPVSSFQQRMTSMEEGMERPDWWDPMLTTQPLTDIHLATNVTSDMVPQGNPQYLLIFSAIGLLILGIACFNYMNLSTARTLPRAGEVGMRKVAGATRGSLVFQFMTEAVVTALLAFPLALLLTEAALPYVQDFLNEEFAYSLFDYPLLLLSALGVVMVSGLISGIYPALVISSYVPADIFRARSSTGSGSSALRKSLVVAQFSIAVLFMVAAAVIHRQLDFMQQKNLGFDQERVVTMGIGVLQDRYPAFKQRVLGDASVVSMSSGAPPGIGHKNMTTSAGRVADSLFMEVPLTVIQVDYDYAETIGLRFADGRDFSEDRSADEGSAVILNEMATRWFGLGEQAVGQQVEISDSQRNVIGVVENYHNESLKRGIQPVALVLSPGNRYTGLARLAPGSIDQGLDAIHSAWQDFFPDRPLEITFLDDRIQMQYSAEQRQGRLMSAFSGIAIFMACFGLLGLVFLMTMNRTKEIGIRKVLGATVTNIVRLLSKDFVKLVVIGFVIAVPAAYYAMDWWLADFAYRIEIGAGVFALAGGAALLIALLTVSWQAVRAALANPVDSLRSE